MGWVSALFGRRRGPDDRGVRFRLRYQRFREILSLNDGVLQLFADIEDRMGGVEPFAVTPLVHRVRRAGMDVFVMVKNLNQITGGRFPALYQALRRIDGAIDGEMIALRGLASGPLVMPVGDLRADDVDEAGCKMANLGEVAAEVGLPVPRGFVVTTAAFTRFMDDGGLWERAEHLEDMVESHGETGLSELCLEVQIAIRAAPVPAPLADAVAAAWDTAFGAAPFRVAVRSSAVGEDAAAASHAGIYETVLDVERGDILDAYRRVVASAFSPAAVAYRFARGLTAAESAMAVGVLEMLEPRAAGIMFSRPPDDPAGREVVISATDGVAAGVAAGTDDAVLIGVARGAEPTSAAGLLAATEVAQLVTAAERLEAHFGTPQDIEWAVSSAGVLTVLQARPMVMADAPEEELPEVLRGATPLLEGGATAFPGLACGPVVAVGGESDLDAFPDGGVLVARHSSPGFVRVMRRCAAIVTDVGSPTGHMAILARELRVPAVVGMAGASRALGSGRDVVVDAIRCRVFAGRVELPVRRPEERSTEAMAVSPARAVLERIADLATPLHLTDPAGPEFVPEACRSLHDITRFVHEKVFEVMFHFGDEAAADRRHSTRLEAELPIEVRIFDLGGALVEEHPGGVVRPEQVASGPLRAFLNGMADMRACWGRPRAVSVKGFFSVLGEGIAGPPAEAQKVGRASYVVASDRYMNFSTKAGYHFSTVDTYCGGTVTKNYIHFRFAGGAADEGRRGRRVRFLERVLLELGFTVEVRGDLLWGRLDKYDAGLTRERLTDLGRLTLCARQLDMLMDTDGSPEYFARAFLAGDWDVF